MKEPTTYEKIHWKVFDFGVKVVGSGLAIISIIFIVLIVRSTIGLTGQADYPLWLLFLFIPLVPLGVLIVKARTYYPEEYKEFYEKDLP